MAKEKKDEKKVQEQQLDVENVMDVVRKGNLIDEEVIKLGDEKDDAEAKERKIRAYRQAKNQAKYSNLKDLLTLRARRREEKITKEKLTTSKELFDDLCAGKITPNEYEEKRKESLKEIQKKFDESNKQLQKEIGELQEQFPGYWCYSWDRCW